MESFFWYGFGYLIIPKGFSLYHIPSLFIYRTHVWGRKVSDLAFGEFALILNWACLNMVRCLLNQDSGNRQRKFVTSATTRMKT